VQAVFQKRPAHQAFTKRSAFSPVAIDPAGDRKGALSLGLESAFYLLDFLFIQSPRTLASQHSVLVAHRCSPFRPVSWPGADRRLPNSATFSRIAIDLAVNTAGALCLRLQSTVHLHDFFIVQSPRTLASQHSVLVVHRCSPFRSIAWPKAL
jgi:hypothetical protein